MNTRYNYICIDDDCKQTDKVRITKPAKNEDKPEYCKECDNELKQIGISTNISHIGTQEANNK